MKILYVTRKYPPSTGGMENAAYELYKALAAKHEVTLIKWGGANKALPVIYPWLFVRALVIAWSKHPDAIYMQDGVMAPMGWLLRELTGRPTVITIHGKEVTYANPVYRVLVPSWVRKQSAAVAVSNETKEQAEEALPGLHAEVVFNGVSDSFYEPSHDTALHTIATTIGMDVSELKQYKILHTNGRFVRRKGVLWFINEVLPKLVSERQPVL
jgi:glycosyltransferase involved in cell wall biosynthesis